MPITDDNLQVSSQFDAQLVTLGDWSLDQKRILNRWLEQISAESKGRMAAQVIASFALDLLNDDLSAEGRVRIKRLQGMASLLEQLVFTTSELEEKFYRDHISHMLKVTLLARAIARKKPFSLGGSQLSTLTLACLFHDIAYPLSECGRIFSKTLESLKNCYSSAELFRNILTKESRADIRSLSILTREDEGSIRTMLKQMNHGLLSAIEFRAWLKNETTVDSYSDEIRAIAIHDSNFETEIDALEDPIIGLLILADELQDWGRPTDQDIAIIPRIEDFRLEDGHLSGRFIAKDYRNFSVLKQVSSKMRNLKRLSLDSDALEFNFRYDIREFREVSHRNYERVLQILYDSVDNTLMDPSKNIDLSESALFERIFFGMDVTIPVKRRLFEDLKSGKLAERLVLKDMHLYLNENLSELILSEKTLERIEAIVLSNENDNRISARIVVDNAPVKGVFYSSSSNETLQFSRYLAAEIRFINYMIHEVGGSKFSCINGFPKLEGLAELSVVENVCERLGSTHFKDIYEKLKLRAMVECLRNRGCFLFI